MAGPFNLGNIASALRITGKNPEFADQLEAQQRPVEAPPAAQVPTPQPAAAPVLEPAPAAQAVPDIEASASTRALKERQTAGTNQAVDLKLQQGNVAAAGAERSAEQYAASAAEGRAGVDEVKARREAAHSRKDENTKQAYAALRQMQDQIGSPPDTSKGKALQVIGALLSMTRGGGGVGAGLQMLGQAMGDDVQAWERGIAGNDKIRKSLLEMNAAEDQGVESELEQEHRLSGLVAATYVNALKQIAAETESKESRRLAEELALGVERKAVDHMLDVRARQAAAQVNSKRDTDIMRLLSDLPEEQRANAAEHIGPRAVELLKGMQGVAKGQADVEKTRADALKATAEGKSGGKLSEGEQKRDAIVAGATDSFRRLQTLLGGGDQVNRGAVRETWVPDAMTSEESLQQRADVTNLVRSILRVESGSNVPENEVQGKISALGIDSGDPDVRARGMRQLLQGFEALDATGRLSGQSPIKEGVTDLAPAGGAPTPAAAPRPTSGANTVSMINPETGEHKPAVNRKLQAQYEALGFVVGKPSIAEPKPELTSSYQRRELPEGGI